MDVLIVGAGPTGLTAGVELARKGVNVTVIDKRTEGSGLSRAVGILPVSLALLEASGVTKQLIAQGRFMKEITFYSGRKCLLKMPLLKPNTEPYTMLSLPQDQTESILRQVLLGFGGQLNYGTECINLGEGEGKVWVEDNHGETHFYDYVIGADGVHSRVRQVLGIDFEGYDLPEIWSIADVEAEDWQNPDSFTGCLVGDRQHVVVIVPLEVGRYRVISNTPDALKTLPLPMNIKRIRRQGTFKLSIRQVFNYHQGRIFLAGDAAHCHSPVGGRGMNLGIADAVELAQRMVNQDLEGYTQSRHAQAAKVIKGSERARSLLTTDSTVKRWCFRGLLSVINHIPFLQRKLIDIAFYR